MSLLVWVSQELRLTQYELPMGGTLGDQRLQSRGLEVWPHMLDTIFKLYSSLCTSSSGKPRAAQIE